MTRAAERLEAVDTDRLAAIERFSKSLHTPGPHPIPPSRQVANEFHRFHGEKCGRRPTEGESGLEALVIFWGESDPEVVSITEQPLRIHGAIGNRPYYTLDVAFRYRDGRVVYYEVKQEKHLKVHEDGSIGPSHWPFIKAWGEANGVEVDFLTERDIWPYRQQIENWRDLLPFAAESYDEPDPDLESAILNLVRNGDAFTALQIEDRHPGIDPQTLHGHIAKLLHQGKLHANLNAGPFTPSSELWVEEEEESLNEAA